MDKFMNKSNQIKDIVKETEEEFIEILEYGKNLNGEEVWTDSEKIQWLRKSMNTLQEEYKKELVEKIEKDLNNGKFYSICNNETTFKNYIINIITIEKK